MPYQQSFNTKTSVDYKSDFISLKAKDQKIKFRILAPPYYEGLHFINENGKYIKSYCPKIMNEQKCSFCEKYFDLIKQAKKSKEEGDLKKEKDLKKEARNYKVKVNFYYPIINRETESGQILKTTLSVRLKIDQEVANGINVLEYDYVLVRTENSGADYYALIRQDSKMSKTLTDKELKEAERIKEAIKKLDRKESNQELEGFGENLE